MTDTKLQSPEPVVEATTVEVIKPSRIEESEATVRNHALIAAATGLVPAPLFDFVALTGLQLKLLRTLGKSYGHDLSDDVGKKLIGSLVSGYLPVALAMPLASLIKAVPLIGQAAGAISMAALASGTTYGIGKVFVQHFESGGNFLNFNPKQHLRSFKQYVTEGRKLSAEQGPAAAAPATTPVAEAPAQ